MSDDEGDEDFEDQYDYAYQSHDHFDDSNPNPQKFDQDLFGNALLKIA